MYASIGLKKLPTFTTILPLLLLLLTHLHEPMPMHGYGQIAPPPILDYISSRMEGYTYRDNSNVTIVELTDSAGLMDLYSSGLRIRYISKTMPVVFVEASSDEVRSVIGSRYVKSIWPDRIVKLADIDILGCRFSLSGYRIMPLNETTIMVNANLLWSMGYTGRGVRIAIVDTGVDSSHPDLHFLNGTSKIVESISFVEEDVEDRHGHGTAMAGIAAGSGLASGGRFKGVAPDALIINVKAFKTEGLEAYSTIEILFKALEYIETVKPDVVCAAWGVYPPIPEDHPFNRLVKRLVDLGIVFVAAAGNLGYQWTVVSPSSTPSVISVGAATRSGVAFFSSRGPDPYSLRATPLVVAPGVRIVAPGSGVLYDKFRYDGYEGYIEISGTSPATAHVAGVVALILSAKPWLTPQAILASLVASAKPFKDVDYTEQGAGLVDAYSCLKMLEEGLQPFEIRVPVEYTSGLRSITLDRRGWAPVLGSHYYKIYGNYTMIGNGLFHLILSERAMLTWLFYSKVRVLEGLSISILPIDSGRWITHESMNTTTGFKVTSFSDRLWSGYADLEYKGVRIRIEVAIPLDQPYIEFKFSKMSGGVELLNVTLTPSIMLGFVEAAYLGGLEGIIVWSRDMFIGLASTDKPCSHLLGGSRDAYAVNPENVTLTFRYSGTPIKIYISIYDSYREVASTLSMLTGRGIVEAFLKPIEVIRVLPPETSSVFRILVRNLGSSRDVRISIRIVGLPEGSIYEYSMSYDIRLDSYTDNRYELRLPKLSTGLYKVYVELENLPCEIHRSYDRLVFDLYVGLYPKIVVPLPSRIDGIEKPFILMYPGDVDYLNVTLISSTPMSWVNAYIVGNASLILRVYSTKSVGFQAYTSIYGYIPDGLEPTMYSGSLVFEGYGGVIASIPISICVREPVAIVLWHDRLDFIPGRNDLYLWYTELWKASALKGVRIVPASLNILQPRRIDLLILPDPYYGYQDIRSILDYFLERDGSAVILAGPAIFALRYGYRTILEEYGLKAVKEPYFRWSNSSTKLDLYGFEELSSLNLTVVYGVFFDISTTTMGRAVQVMFRALEVGPYGFLNVSKSFYSSFICRSLPDGRVKLFVYSSVYSFDDLWCRLGYEVKWDVEEGRLIGYVEPIENATTRNIDLLTIITSRLSNKPPRILSINVLDSRVEQMFESYTLVVAARDEESDAGKLNVTARIEKPNGVVIHVGGSYLKDGVYILYYTPGMNDPIGEYRVVVRVEDMLHAYSERYLKFEVIPPVRSILIIIILVGVPFAIIGYILGRRARLRIRE